MGEKERASFPREAGWDREACGSGSLEKAQLLRRLSMSTEEPIEILPPEKPIPHGEGPQPLPRPRFSGRRLVFAFAIAALADGLSFFLTFTPPVQWAVDLVTAVLLFVTLGWQWILLPGLIMERSLAFMSFRSGCSWWGRCLCGGPRGQNRTDNRKIRK